MSPKESNRKLKRFSYMNIQRRQGLCSVMSFVRSPKTMRRMIVFGTGDPKFPRKNRISQLGLNWMMECYSMCCPIGGRNQTSSGRP